IKKNLPPNPTATKPPIPLAVPLFCFRGGPIAKFGFRLGGGAKSVLVKDNLLKIANNNIKNEFLGSILLFFGRASRTCIKISK
ncbi:hypothetical protein V3Q77_14615, partial [Flavobacterium davisii]